MDREALRQQCIQVSAPFWILDNSFVNENQKPIEFYNHRYMVNPYADNSPRQVIMKSAQVGWSILAILRSIHLARYQKMNVIYVLPTRKVVDDFVVPKVDPMVERNPEILKMLGKTDSKQLKQIGDRFVYFRGAFSRREGISISADLVIADEYDISDQQVLKVYESRLNASDWGWYWKFSNPTIPGFGVHEMYQESDQMEWLVTCELCGHESRLELDPDVSAQTHYINRIKQVFACGKCQKEITDAARRNGRWVAQSISDVRGYHLSQMIVPYVSASKILQQEKDMSVDVFHNFVLGQAYQESEFMLDAESLRKTCVNEQPQKDEVFIGCDSGKTKHFVIGNKYGVFAYGKTNDWATIENLIVKYNATTVIDALPDFTIPEALARKYAGQVYVHYYKHDTTQLDPIVQKERKDFGVVQSDRTKIFDLTAQEIVNKKIKFYMSYDKLRGDGQGLVYHASNVYRVVETDRKGIERGRWHKKDGKPDHWAHALIYWRVATELGAEGGIIQPLMPSKTPKTFGVREDNTVPVKEVIDIEKSLDYIHNKITL